MEILVTGLTIFVLAVFVGFEVITKVPPTLHTPLMSGSNAISGITLIGALISAGSQHATVTTIPPTDATAASTRSSAPAASSSDRPESTGRSPAPT